MAKYTQNLTANGDTLLARVKTPRNDSGGFGASIFIYGTFDSGTATVQVSPDGGTTKFTVKDQSGSDIAPTANFYSNFELGIANVNGEELEIYVNLAGATSPDITVDLYDTR